LQVTLDLGTQHLRSRAAGAIALAAFTGSMFKVNPVAVVVLALAIGTLFLRPPKKDISAGPATPPKWLTARRAYALAAAVTVVLAATAAAIVGSGARSVLGEMALSFLKVGSIAFGNGTAIIPLLQSEVVEVHRWLPLNVFLDGLALGQITPGPVLITAAFVGFRLGGMLGAAIGTFAIFAPSVVMTMLFTTLFRHVRELGPIRGALAGVLAAFVGLLAALVLSLGSASLQGPMAYTLAAAAFVAMRIFKLDVAWVLLGGLALWALHIVLAG
ncbi:MAG: chromate transporter, partial [Chloroflexota bacterium]